MKTNKLFLALATAGALCLGFSGIGYAADFPLASDVGEEYKTLQTLETSAGSIALAQGGGSSYTGSSTWSFVLNSNATGTTVVKFDSTQAKGYTVDGAASASDGKTIDIAIAAGGCTTVVDANNGAVTGGTNSLITFTTPGTQETLYSFSGLAAAVNNLSVDCDTILQVDGEDSGGINDALSGTYKLQTAITIE